MVIKDAKQIDRIKAKLLDKLRGENAFWSYSQESVGIATIHDDQLIAMSMRYLDLPEIGELFRIFSIKKIKEAWKRLLVPEGEYLYTLNRFFAWYYFDAKNPDAYLKNLQTRHLNRMLNQ
jgi:hypothetical protein